MGFKKTIVLVVFTLVFSVLSCTMADKAKSTSRAELKTTREKFSYGLGYDFGPNMKHIKSGVDLQMFLRGLEDYLNEKESLVPQAERQRIRAEEFTRIGDEYIAMQEAIANKNFQAGEAF